MSQIIYLCLFIHVAVVCVIASNKTTNETTQPLFLTQYINNGHFDKARKLARVSFTDTLGIKSYSGYFTVNETYDSNLFMWYFPAQNNSLSAPVLIWLNGGPGASLLLSLFFENGPLTVVNKTIEPKEYSWTVNHNVIYVDNPVGTGFSFTNDSRGYCNDETQVGEDLYTMLQQFFQLFPRLQKNDFYITGESYAGKYVPALAYTIHRKNENNPKIKINLQGIAIGNGLCDPIHQQSYEKYLYQIGLIDSNAVKEFDQYENQAIQYINNNQFAEAFDVINNLLLGFVGNKSTVFYNLTGLINLYNYLEPPRNRDLTGFLENPEIILQLNVGNRPFNDGALVLSHLESDFLKSVAPWISELLNHYKFLFYTGQVDIVVPYPHTVEFLKHLNFSGSEHYKVAKRHIWRVDDEIAGYVKQTGNLTELLVRNAGHMVPGDQPKWALDMITKFIRGYSLY